MIILFLKKKRQLKNAVKYLVYCYDSNQALGNESNLAIK